MSLEDLRKGYDEWRGRYYDAVEKYRDLKSEDTTKDVTLFSAKLCYFYLLSNYCLYSLSVYTKKLRKEYESLKSPKVKTKRKRRTKS